jgi:hypothetical protein
MKKDFITATPDSGGSGSTTVTVAASANQTESTRSTSLSVAGGGMTRTVGASQAAGVVTWNYYFSVTPTSLSFVDGGETKSVTVISYRKKVINGVETSTQENVAWTATISGTGFSKNTDGTSITAASNQSGSRGGSVSYTQTGSGKTQAVSLLQAAVVSRFTLTIKFRNYTGATAYLFNSTGIPLYGPNDYYSMGSGYENASIMWNNTNGLTVCKPGSRMETVQAKAGDTITVRIQRGGQNIFDSRYFSTFTLKAENQTITP